MASLAQGAGKEGGALNVRAAKTCWQAATVRRYSAPLGMGRLFWLRRALYYLTIGKD